jgi:photosystem II stability/assembly factor-like uncharacterized protein
MDGSVRPAVFLTSDAGRTWRAAKVQGLPAQRAYCWKVFFLDRSQGFVSVADSGAVPMILKTVDGGETWQTLKLDAVGPDEWDLQGIAFLNEHHGWVGQLGGAVFETKDGGKTWAAADAVLSDVNRFRTTRTEMLACGDAIYRLAHSSK